MRSEVISSRISLVATRALKFLKVLTVASDHKSPQICSINDTCSTNVAGHNITSFLIDG